MVPSFCACLCTFIDCVGALFNFIGECCKFACTLLQAFGEAVDVEFGFSCMGYEIAGGWGARIAQAEREPDKDTIVFTGDGSYLLMNSDIYSSVLTGKKLIILVLDNGGFAVINKLQNNTGNESFNNLIADTPTATTQFADDFEAHAAAMGATAYQKGLGAIHALSHPIGANYHTHHGTTNAVCMPAVLRFNKPAITARLAQAAAYLGLDGGYDGFCAYVDDLNASLGIPKSLTDLGVTDPDVARIVAGALIDPSTGGNPIEMTRSNTEALLRACL